MIVYYLNLYGKVVSLEVEETDSIAHLKTLIEQKENLTPAQQRLIFAGKVMDDSSTCGEYNQNGKVFHLIERKLEESAPATE